MSRLAFVLTLALTLVWPAPSDAHEPRGAQVAQSKISRDFFVGAWEAQVEEFDKRYRIIWTLWEDGRLIYHFGELPYGPLLRGSSGAWRVDRDEVHEVWERPDGSRGAGYGRVEKVDENTIRLTIIDNGDPRYTGLVRVYRRIGAPELS